ncbi:MAG: LPS-assembly protein LptD [Pseudobdellovibrio sp.]
MRIVLFFYFLIALILPFQGRAAEASVSSTSAKIRGFVITSDELERDNENELVYLKGNVKVVYQTQYFEADTITLDLRKKQAHLLGNVKVQTLTHQIGGQEIILDYESNQGIIYYGYVQANNIRFQGDLIEQQNNNEYYVDNADYTTCSNCPATWSFQGTKIKAELGGYAYIKNSFLKVAGVPILWLPYLVVPLKSDRQTGLLTPEIGYTGNRRLIFTESFFWAASRSQDATFTFKNYELGGLKPMIEHRYAASPTTSGNTHFAFLNDKVFASDDRYNNYLEPDKKNSPFTRWALNSNHVYSPNRDEKVRAQLALVSDLQYPKDFYDEFTNYSDSALENKLSYTHTFEHSLVSAETSYYRNLLQANPLSTNNNSVHRLPELHYDSTIQQIGDMPLYYSISTNFTKFSRDKAYDDISVSGTQRYVSNNLNDPTCENKANPNCYQTNDGTYDPNQDIIRTGNRLLFKATAYTESYNIGNSINLAPQVSYNEADYSFPVGEKETASRRYLQFELNTRTKFNKVYDADVLETGEKYKNEIIPEIKYSYIPWFQQDDNPFFGDSSIVNAPYSLNTTISDTDVNTRGGVLFDYNDRVYDRHILSFSLLDRLVKKKMKDNSYKTIVNFNLTQSYDLYQAQQPNTTNQPLSDLAGTLVVDLDQIQSYTQVNYSPYRSATNTLSTLSYLNSNQQYFKVGLSSNRIQDPIQDDISFAIGFVSSYVNVLTGVIFDASPDRDSSSRLKKYSLIMQLKPPGECWAVNFYRDQKVGLEAEWKIKFDFSFDGKPTKVIPPDELNINL